MSLCLFGIADMFHTGQAARVFFHQKWSIIDGISVYWLAVYYVTFSTENSMCFGATTANYVKCHFCLASSLCVNLYTHRINASCGRLAMCISSQVACDAFVTQEASKATV